MRNRRRDDPCEFLPTTSLLEARPVDLTVGYRQGYLIQIRWCPRCNAKFHPIHRAQKSCATGMGWDRCKSYHAPESYVRKPEAADD